MYRGMGRQCCTRKFHAVGGLLSKRNRAHTLINTAHADPDVRVLGLSSTRGGDESRRSPAVGAAEARQTATGGAGGEGAVAPLAPLVAFSDLGSAVGKSRVLSEGLWGRAFLTAYNSASGGERLKMTEGLGKGAGLALLAVPMTEAFTFTQAQFQRILLLSNFLGLENAIGVPHTHHCGGGEAPDTCPDTGDCLSPTSMPSARTELGPA